mmetsp:Transcript_39729/g.95574  ORF Transcript_39729/g.95574 Transcript_39729/m.95574 type:complete len:91 (+) Transcript_39729:729-1001(+)
MHAMNSARPPAAMMPAHAATGRRLLLSGFLLSMGRSEMTLGTVLGLALTIAVGVELGPELRVELGPELGLELGAELGPELKLGLPVGAAE